MGWVLKLGDHTVSQAIEDLAEFGVDLDGIMIHRDIKRRHTSDCFGIAYTDKREIWIHPGLIGAELYRVVLHEIGHVLGLEHTRDGIMAAKRKAPEDFQTKSPTLRQRRAWCFEVAQAVLEYRRKTWRKAA